jgi:hyaluronate lyase
MGADVEVGLCVTSHNNSVLCAAVFDNVTITSGVPEIVLDNADATGITKVGTWNTSTTVPGYYGANYLTDTNSGKGSKTVTFTPSIPVTGTYEVYMRWAAAAGRSNSVPVTVTHAGGTTSPIYVNQQLNNGIWMLIGTYTFNAGSTGNLLISNTGTTGDVIADAVKFVKQ